MDNLTHTLLGLSVADLLIKASKSEKTEEPRFHYCVWFLAFVANNLPDLDYVYILFLPFRRTNLLLQHRGHTHTFLLAPGFALLVLVAFWAFCRLKKWHWERRDWVFFFAVSVSGICLHILLDSLNSYGVRPFWPFNNRWYYADAVFVVEPFFWALFSALLFFSRKTPIVRLGFATIALAAVALSWFSGYLFWQAALFTTVVTLLSFWLGKKTDAAVHAGLTWATAVSFILFFLLVSQSVRIKTVNSIFNDSPGVVVHDVVRTSLPTNPFCWGIVTVESLGPVASYRMQRGMVTPFANFIAHENCLALPVAKAFQNAQNMVKYSKEVVWLGSIDLPINTLRGLAESHCGFSAFLQFSRAPVFKLEKEGLRMWDMRFDLRGKNFTEDLQQIPWEKGPNCPFSAPWIPPREDLLELR